MAAVAEYLDPSSYQPILRWSIYSTACRSRRLALQAVRAGLAVLPDSPELAERLTRLERR